MGLKLANLNKPLKPPRGSQVIYFNTPDLIFDMGSLRCISTVDCMCEY